MHRRAVPLIVLVASVGACLADEVGSDVSEPSSADDAACTDALVRTLPLDLDAVPPVSVPVVVSEYLNQVQLAVRDHVGDDVFGGAVATDADKSAMTITIHGTDTLVLDDAVRCIAPGARDRVTIVESRHSVNDLEGFSVDAQQRLEREGIDAIVAIRWGLDAVDVSLVTPDGEPNPEREAAAAEVLSGVPTVITFSGPRVRPVARDEFRAARRSG